MFVLSKLKQVMGHGSSEDNNTEGEAAKSDEECKGKPKGDVEELLEQCSQFEEMDTQDFSDSPILFPSQTSDDKKKSEEEDSDCYEIVDKINTVKDSDKEKHKKGLNNKSCLSLGRKRQVCEKSGECSARDSSSSKQRRVENEDNDPCTTTTSHKERCLFRVYKRPVCENIEEADRRNLFYAPRHVKPALYTPTIVRKLESYRWRLRHAQSSLRSYVFPLHPKAIDPILARSRARMGGRIKRVSVMKKSTPDYTKWAEGKRNIDPFVAALCDILVSTVKEEVHSAASSNEVLDKRQTNNNGDDEDDDVVCTKVSHCSRKTSKTAETTELSTSGTSQHTDVMNNDATVHDVAMETENCDVPVKTVDNDVVEAVNRTVDEETVKNDVVAGNVKNAVVIETVNNETAPSVKQVLPAARRKIILEKGNSDDYLPSVEENKTEEEDCVVVEAVSSTSVAMETSHQETVDHIECPMCYKKFPQNTVQEHAFHCNGLDEASTSSVRTAQNGEMSPVIKTRTPTKVKELKLLAKVEIKANEFGVERKGIKKKPMGKIETNTKQSNKRVSLEPSIKLAHFHTKWMKCGESKTKGKETVVKENEKSTSPLRQNKQPPQQKRVSVINARKNLERRSWPDVASLKKDFIPLEFVGQKENEKIPSKDVHKLLLLMDTNSTDSSSDEESHQKKHNTSKRKSTGADDDMSALSMMAADYQNHKRKRNKTVNNNAKKMKVSDENATEHCYVCGKDIPRLQFNKHVNEEIERQRKEDEAKDFSLSVMSSLSQTSDDASTENTTTSRISVSLPDLAEGTIWQTNSELEKEEKVNNKQFSGQSTQNKRCSGRERRSSLRKT